MACVERVCYSPANRNCTRQQLDETENTPVPAVIVEPVPVIPGTMFNLFGYSASDFGGCGCTTSCVMSFLNHGTAIHSHDGTKTDSETNTEDSDIDIENSDTNTEDFDTDTADSDTNTGDTDTDTAESDSLVEVGTFCYTPPTSPTDRVQRRGRRYRHVPHTPDISRGPTPNRPHQAPQQHQCVIIVSRQH